MVDPGDEITAIHRRPHRPSAHAASRSSLRTPTSTTSAARSTSSRLLARPSSQRRRSPAAAMMDEQAAWIGIETPRPSPPTKDLRILNRSKCPRHRYPAQVLHTPGHTEGILCLHCRSEAPPCRRHALRRHIGPHRSSRRPSRQAHPEHPRTPASLARHHPRHSRPWPRNHHRRRTRLQPVPHLIFNRSAAA